MSTRTALVFALIGAVSLGAQVPNSAQSDGEALKKATFAGGCFWCMEPPFDKLKGVISTTSGYTGGHKKHPSYEEVSAGVTGHAEAVSPLEVERPHSASRRMSPHPIRRTPVLEANGGEPPAAGVSRLERDSVRRHGRTRSVANGRPT